MKKSGERNETGMRYVRGTIPGAADIRTGQGVEGGMRPHSPENSTCELALEFGLWIFLLV